MRRLPSFIAAVMVVLALAACKDKPAAAAKPDEGAAFLAQNAKAPDVHVLPDGLQYKIITSGPATGLRPKKADEVKVHYEGRLLGPPTDRLKGDVFDSSYEGGAPRIMRPDQLIPAWTEALQLMRPGDVWMIYVPPKLGYGDKDMGPIPSGSTLIFKLELLDVLPDATSVGRG